MVFGRRICAAKDELDEPIEVEEKGTLPFIKGYMTREINSSSRNMKATITMVGVAVSNENTWKRLKINFEGVIGANEWPTEATKNFQEIVVDFQLKRSSNGDFISVVTEDGKRFIRLQADWN
jgi:hypothetical protein